MAQPVKCAKCGATLGPEDWFCSNCGEPRARPAPRPAVSVDGPAAAAQFDWQRLPVVRGLPLELWAAAVALVGCGVWLLVISVKHAVEFVNRFNALRRLALSTGSTLPDVAHALERGYVISLALPGLVGALMALIGWRLAQRDGVARWVAVGLLPPLFISVVFGGNAARAEVVALVLTGIAALVLALTPRVRAVFASGGASPVAGGTSPAPMTDGEHRDAPPPTLAAARVLLLVGTICTLFATASYLLYGSAKARYTVAGICFAMLGIVSVGLWRGLELPSRKLRVAVSIVAGAYLVVQLVLGLAQPGLLLMLGFMLTATGYLWLAADVRTALGDPALPFGTQQPPR